MPIKINGKFIQLGVENTLGQVQWYQYDSTSVPKGQGAMGVVYVGSCISSPGEKVAIKRVYPQFETIPSIRKRALLEGNLQFSHPNLVEMLGSCEQSPGQGALFIISRLVQGVTLEFHVEKNLQSDMNRSAKICGYMYPVLDALAFLHSKGIVHLDIKPSNIMIENGSHVRLMDLGIAYDIDSPMTINNGVIGTPPFAAPEQFVKFGDTPALNATTDIYQLGVCLYVLLTGVNPYNADTISECKELHETVILPYRKSIPNKLVDVLRKATLQDQSLRYQTVNEMKSALRSALNPEETWYHKYRLIIIFLVVFIGIFVLLISFQYAN